MASGPCSISARDTELRVGMLEQDIGRVVMKRDGGYRLDRGWSIAPGGLEPPYEGRSRDSTEGFACPEASVTRTETARSCSKPRA